jgi:hypothetical protein
MKIIIESLKLDKCPVGNLKGIYQFGAAEEDGRIYCKFGKVYSVEDTNITKVSLHYVR